MRGYATSVDLRRALEVRLKQQADETGTDLSRLRRIAVFDRVAARLSATERRWMLKGGTSLEFRLGVRARATKDLDLALLDGPGDGDFVRDELIETLAVDVDRDRFVFSVKQPLEANAAGRPGWRFSVDSVLAGKTFAQIRLDVVLRGEELAATERITLPGMLAFADGRHARSSRWTDVSTSRRDSMPSRATTASDRTPGSRTSWTWSC